MSTGTYNGQTAAPGWLRTMGFSSWLLVGFMLIIVGVIWLLGQTSTIVMPVIAAAVLGAVAGPAVGWLEQHRVPRIGGAVLVLLGLVAIGALIFLMVFGGISANSGDISAKVNQALAKIEGWLADLGVDNAQSAKEGVQKSGPEIRETLLGGVADGVAGLKSLAFFLGFATLSTLFVLKDGPIMRAFINRHMGVPEPVAAVVTANVAKSLRSYFLGVSIIAAFNAVVIGAAALIVGVPLAGTIAVVTFVGAYVPFVGAWVSGAFAVLIALGTVGTDAAIVMAVVALLGNSVLQQLIQPFVMGATLSLNPLVVLVVTIGAGALFGMVGLTLAAPLTSAAVHIANELRDHSAETPTVRQAAPDGTPGGAGGARLSARTVRHRMIASIDAWQRRHALGGFPFAVFRKFGDDRASNLAALIAYYAFFSVFPLLLALVSVLGFVLEDDPSLREDVVDTAVARIPVIGDELADQVQPLTGSGVALAVGLGGALWAGLGVTLALGRAFGEVWDVPRVSQPSGLKSRARGLAVLIILLVTLIVATALTGLAAGGGIGPALERGLAIAASLGVNALVFLTVFALLTPKPWGLPDLLPGVALAAVGWLLLQAAGGWYVDRAITDASAIYGTFAAVIGLLSWFWLGSQLLLVAAEVNVVLRWRLWPRSLSGELTPADRLAWERFAEATRRDERERIAVSFRDDPDQARVPDQRDGGHEG